MGKNRLIPTSELPESLWCSEKKCLILPPLLVSAWHTLLEAEGLTDKAKQPVPEKLIGGITKEATDDHLTWRFTGSSARVQMAMLDPLASLDQISDAFAKTFSGGKVFLADLPCGSGAAVLTILATIAELRAANKIPRTPLDITVLGGELSEFARAYATEALSGLLNALEEVGVFVSAEFLKWDACDKFSNADLIRELTLRSQGCGARMLVLANFSGFLQHSGKWNAAKDQFDALFLHSRDVNSCAIWIEPLTNTVTAAGGFLARLVLWFQNVFGTLTQQTQLVGDESQPIYGSSNAKAQHPLRPEHQFNSNLAVVRFDLPIEAASK